MAIIIGDNDANFLIGTTADDRLEGLGGGDVLYGLYGVDVLRGGAGGDYLDGGIGNDYADYTTSAAAVVVHLATGMAYGGDANGDTLVSIEGAYGSKHGDWLVGTAEFNYISGEAGDDLLQGGGGGDTLVGGAGNDTIEGGEGNDTLVGGAGGDLLIGGAGSDLVTYEVSPTGVIVNLPAGAGAVGDASGDGYIDIENVWGSAFQDLITGTDGTNGLRGLDGNDVIAARQGHDAVEGGDGDDSLSGDGGNDLLAGDFGSDTLYGGTGRDTMLGGVGNDYLSGENGPDILTGGAGADILTGGTYDDRFVYLSAGDSFTAGLRDYRDRITDFSQADKDRIDVGVIDAVAGTTGVNEAFRFIGTASFTQVAGQLRYKIVNGSTYVQADIDGNGTADFQISLAGEIALKAGDFLL